MGQGGFQGVEDRDDLVQVGQPEHVLQVESQVAQGETPSSRLQLPGRGEHDPEARHAYVTELPAVEDHTLHTVVEQGGHFLL